MKPLSTLTEEAAKRIALFATDLDDTLLDHGALSPDAYAALARISAQVPVVVVTGRPLGWAEVLVRMWPVAAVVAENGAASAVRDGQRVLRWFVDPPDSARTSALREEMRAAFPDVRPSDDAHLRVTDVTFDVGETVALSQERIEQLTRFATERGARVTVSSVHLHATFAVADKAQGLVWLAQRRFALDATAARSVVAYVGDSGNDASCFAAFSLTFGVANVRAHVARLTVPPRWVAHAPMGCGFVEIVDAILRARG